MKHGSEDQAGRGACSKPDEGSSLPPASAFSRAQRWLPSQVWRRGGGLPTVLEAGNVRSRYQHAPFLSQAQPPSLHVLAWWTESAGLPLGVSS